MQCRREVRLFWKFTFQWRMTQELSANRYKAFVARNNKLGASSYADEGESRSQGPRPAMTRYKRRNKQEQKQDKVRWLNQKMAAKSYRPNSSRRVLLGGRGKFGNLHDFEDFAVTKDFIALLIKVTKWLNLRFRPSIPLERRKGLLTDFIISTFS